MTHGTNIASDATLLHTIEYLDPIEYLGGNRRIVVDTSALLESRSGYAGGVPQLVMNCANALADNPLVIPKAVLNELTKHETTLCSRTIEVDFVAFAGEAPNVNHLVKRLQFAGLREWLSRRAALVTRLSRRLGELLLLWSQPERVGPRP